MSGIAANTWQPIPLDELRERIVASEEEMSLAELRLWELVRVVPEKWALPPWGDEGGGFWVVGKIGGQVVWYNDIEEGFNISRYRERGVIGAYWCNQGSLQPVMWNLLHQIETGATPTPLGPPQAVGSQG